MTGSADNEDRSLARDGFLSPEVEEWTRALRSANAQWFALAEGFSRFGMKALHQACDGADTELKSISHALFARCLSNFQAILLLIERGLVVEALSIARVGLEGVIILANLAEKKDAFLADMRKNELDANYKLVKELLGPPGPDGIDEKFRPVVEGVLNQLEKVSRKKQAPVDQLAASGRIRPIYGMYRELSRDCHPTLFSIGRYRNKVAPDRVEILFDPSIAEKAVASTLQKACAVFIGAVVGLSAIVDEQLQTDEFRALLAEYDRLFPPGRLAPSRSRPRTNSDRS